MKINKYLYVCTYVCMYDAMMCSTVPVKQPEALSPHCSVQYGCIILALFYSTFTLFFAWFAVVIVEFLKPFYVVAEGNSTSVCVSKSGKTHIPLSVAVFSCPNVKTRNMSTADGEYTHNCKNTCMHTLTHAHIHTCTHARTHAHTQRSSCCMHTYVLYICSVPPYCHG